MCQFSVSHLLPAASGKCREIIALLLNNLKETKLKIYKSVFVGAVVSSELFKHKGTCMHSPS